MIVVDKLNVHSPEGLNNIAVLTLRCKTLILWQSLPVFQISCLYEALLQKCIPSSWLLQVLGVEPNFVVSWLS